MTIGILAVLARPMQMRADRRSRQSAYSDCPVQYRFVAVCGLASAWPLATLVFGGTSLAAA